MDEILNLQSAGNEIFYYYMFYYFAFRYDDYLIARIYITILIFKTFLNALVFGSLDRPNSMKNAANCRLDPLVPCIQEFSQVYDYIVKLLYKLHSCKIIYTSSAVPSCKFFLIHSMCFFFNIYRLS